MSSLQCTLVSLTHQPLVLVTPVWDVVNCQGVSTRHRDRLRGSSRVSVPEQYWGRGSSRRTLTYQVLLLSFCHSNCGTIIVVVDRGCACLNCGCGILIKERQKYIINVILRHTCIYVSPRLAAGDTSIINNELAMLWIWHITMDSISVRIYICLRLQGVQVLSPVYHSVWLGKPWCNW